jgi:phosphatidylglycerol:prolipoprotein diacylglycerol transferase
MTGIFVALAIGLRETKRVGLKKDDLLDGFLWIVPISILGARFWYVIFELDQFVGGGFFPSLLRMLGFSSGTLDFSTFGLSGLAIHGAFVVAVISAYFYTRKRKIDIFKMLDIVAVGFIIAQAFGRWGNFFNQEAHGGIVGGVINGQPVLAFEEQFNFLRYTLHIPEFIVNNMFIEKGLHSLAVEPYTGYYHPTFLYESMLNILGFAIMLVLRRFKKIHFGELFAFYLIWYGGVRIFIESMRTDPLVFEVFGMTLKSAQVTSTIMILAGIALSILVRLKRKGMDYSTAEKPWF